jgi:shikimate kinase
MGTGKSSVGQVLARMLRFRLVDTDDLIERYARRTITAIFAQEGEARFREYESAVVEDLLRYRRTVIATGGGLVTNPANLESLKSHALVVCLWASAETIWKRVRYQAHRPLLNTPDPMATIRKLLADRGPAYREADVLIGTDVRSVKSVALHVAHQFRQAQASHPPREKPNPTASAGAGI